MIASSSKSGKLNNESIAVISVILSSVFFSFGDAVVKLVSADLVLWQILVMRSIIAIPALVMVCRFRTEPINLIPTDVFWSLSRSFLMVLMWVLYYVSLLALPVSIAASIYFTMPVILTFLAAIIIGDKIGLSGWAGAILGFMGVLVIIRPESSGFSIYSVVPFFAALVFAYAMIITRTKLKNEHPYTLTIALQVSFLFFGLLMTSIIYFLESGDYYLSDSFFGGSWKSMGIREWTVVCTLAVAITIGNIGTTISYQLGRSSVIATFSFSYIPFVIVWAWILLGEYPDLFSLLGVGLIIVSGLFAVRKR